MARTSCFQSQRTHLSLASTSFIVCCTLALAGCSGPEGSGSELNQEGTGSGGSESGINLGSGGGDSINLGSGGGDSSIVPGPYVVPADYTPAEFGAWKLGPVVTANTTGDRECSDEIIGLVRDFKRGDPGHEAEGHPDFQRFFNDVATPGLILDTLVDLKPVYSGKGAMGSIGTPQMQMTSEADFLAWYNSDPEQKVNRTYEIYFSLEPNNGVRTFESNAFFPLNGTGFGSEPPFEVNAGLPDHQTFPEQNFHFTTEIHTKFNYRGGEVFSFKGDDDLWVFINNQLVIDLGGLHPQLEGQVALDSLGLAPGTEYSLDLFHAERGMPSSNFRIDSTLEFTGCVVIK